MESVERYLFTDRTLSTLTLLCSSLLSSLFFMKIILSRKGLDSSFGAVPSPLFPDGTLWSLPIPAAAECGGVLRYADVRCGEHALGDLVRDLSGGRISADQPAHLDPDLCHASLPRMPGCRPLFGQCGAAETHLQRQGVGPGDLFLFFGWFRQVERVGDTYRYVAGAPDLHVLFGWLQVAERRPLDDAVAVPTWARYHPHCQHAQFAAPNSLYIAAEHLDLPGASSGLLGAGRWPRFRPQLQLTAPAMSRSVWRLPAWFHPCGRDAALSYHARPDRWQLHGDHVLLRTVGRGQEFVLDCDAYPEALAWAAGLFER